MLMAECGTVLKATYKSDSKITSFERFVLILIINSRALYIVSIVRNGLYDVTDLTVLANS